MTVCPCCGFKFEGDLRAGCTGCGARAVGEPLARPEHILPAYGHALFISTAGVLLFLIFAGSTLAALLERASFSLSFWSIVASAETAAWRLKWLALPVIVPVFWLGWRICARIRREPARFIGRDFAHMGLGSVALVALMFVTFIGITVPERLRKRQLGIEAAQEAPLYTFNRAMLEYRTRYETFPSDPNDLRKLPDPDGSIAAVLANLDSTGYKTWALQASLPAKKPRSLRGAVIRPVSTNAGTDDLPGEGVSFDNYELRLPGEDKILGTDDDWKIVNGVVTKPSQSPRQTANGAQASDANAP